MAELDKSKVAYAKLQEKLVEEKDSKAAALLDMASSIQYSASTEAGSPKNLPEKKSKKVINVKKESELNLELVEEEESPIKHDLSDEEELIVDQPTGLGKRMDTDAISDNSDIYANDVHSVGIDSHVDADNVDEDYLLKNPEDDGNYETLYSKLNGHTHYEGDQLVMDEAGTDTEGGATGRSREEFMGEVQEENPVDAPLRF